MQNAVFGCDHIQTRRLHKFSRLNLYANDNGGEETCSAHHHTCYINFTNINSLVRGGMRFEDQILLY